MCTQRGRKRSASSEAPLTNELTYWCRSPYVARKRQCSREDNGSNDDIRDSSRNGSDNEQDQDKHDDDEQSLPSTPKRSHIAPLELPRGIQPSDFHDQYIPTAEEKNKQGTQIETERDGQQWSLEDDHVLIEIVLGKLYLSESDWERCARSLGRDSHSVSGRWNSLMQNHAVGLKLNTGRGKNYDTISVEQRFGLLRLREQCWLPVLE
ncbi:hypothetical protein GGR51DRAFT_511120 [Nemania sp. FL0031]|nr:hypothetical protein GGR51DRAFT_511120 [Nemania sp. FL0031]